MSGSTPTPTVGLRERSFEFDGGQERLPKCVGLSLLIHGIFILGLFLMPYFPARTIVPPPIYTVDLVGGERIGGNNLATEFSSNPVPKRISPLAAPEPPGPPAKPKKEAKSDPPSPTPEIKKETKKEKVEKPVKAQKEMAEEAAILPEKGAAKNVTKKEAAKDSPATRTTESGTETKTDEGSLDRVRERLIQSAVERVRSRTEATERASKGGAISSGTGEGLGSASLGPGAPGGGGVAKGIEFIAYQNQMLSTIKSNWAWVGQNSNLKVVVQFHIKDNGDIVGLKIVQPSGDPSYDESVLRAVTKSSPLSAPPQNYRKEFSDIRITFRPKDLGA